MNAITDWALTILVSYGAWMLVFIAYIGSLGIPFPITIVIIAAGAFARQGILDWRLALLACLAGAALADNSEYVLGRFARGWLARRFSQKPVWQQAHGIFDRQGGWAILLTRFWLTPLAPAINLIAGGCYSFPRFLLFDLSGELLWVLLYGGLGYFFAWQWEWVSQLAGNLGGLSFGLVLLAGCVFLLVRRRKASHSIKNGLATIEDPAERDFPLPLNLHIPYTKSKPNPKISPLSWIWITQNCRGEYSETGLTPPISWLDLEYICSDGYTRMANNTYRMTTTPSYQPQLAECDPPRLAWTCRAEADDLREMAGSYEPISLDDMDAVALLDRIDKKYVLTTAQLLSALEALQADYWMLEVGGLRLNRYRTIYFDTPDYTLFSDHINGRAERYKIRSREYSDSQLAFLEVKHRTRKDRTIKERIPTECLLTGLTPQVSSWLSRVCPLEQWDSLEPALSNTFTRLTLVSKYCCERVTLDVDLSFNTSQRGLRWDGLAIAEVKMNKANHHSPFFNQMRIQRIHAGGFSKYAVGLALLAGGLKKNTLKPLLLWLNKSMKEPAYYD